MGTSGLNPETIDKYRQVSITPKPENAEKTDQADQIVQTDHLTGHPADQTFFTFSVEMFSHLPDLPLFTFSVEIFFTFTEPVVFHI